MSRTGNRRNPDATVIQWLPLLVPLVALLAVLTVYFIDWSVLTGTHRRITPAALKIRPDSGGCDV